MVRVPLPIKARVESLIADYRDSVLIGNESITSDNEKLTELESAIKLVDRFIREAGQEENLRQRNNTNLVRFRNWLNEKLTNRNPNL